MPGRGVFVSSKVELAAELGSEEGSAYWTDALSPSMKSTEYV